MNPFSRLVLASLTALTLALAGCATQPFEQLPTNARPASRWTSDAALQARIMALDPAHISDRDVRDSIAIPDFDQFVSFSLGTGFNF